MTEAVDISTLDTSRRFVPHCRVCDTALTLPLQLVTEAPPAQNWDDGALVPRGTAVRIEVNVRDGKRDRLAPAIAVNCADVRHLELVEGWSGCCGPDGSQLNLVCYCGELRASRCADCWQRHHVLFEPADVVFHVL